MVTTPTTDPGAYQDLDRLRQRVQYDGDSLFQDNAELRFDQLLVELERESRAIYETLWGDQTPLTEEGRTDEKRTTDDAAMLLVYPINDVQEVEYKRTLASDFETLDARFWDYTEHRLILARNRPSAVVGQANPTARNARRATWRDIAARIRVTYDRGFGDTPPADILSLQVDLINKMLRKLRTEQTVAAASADELGDAVGAMDDVVDDELRARINDVTSPGGATLSI